MTNPNPELLPSLSGEPELASDLDRYARFLDEVLHFGTVLFSGLMTAGEGDKTETEKTAVAVALSQYRWSLDLLGSIAAQVRAGWIDASAVTLRAEFEAILGFRYLVADQGTMAARAQDYLVAAMRRDIHALERYEEGTQKHKQLKSTLSKDDEMKSLAFNPPQAQVIAELTELRRILDDPKYRESRDEYNSTLKARGSRPDWYSLRGGPKNLEALAREVGAAGQYELFYRTWSLAAHSLDVVNGTLRFTANNFVGFAQLRKPHNVHDLVTNTARMVLGLYEKAIDALAPNEKIAFQKWYLTIRDEFLREKLLQIVQDE